MSTLRVFDPCLVVLVGASGSGKSSFARKHFRPTEVLSSDYFRGLVSDDENDQEATADAFDALHYVASKRLSKMRLTVVDATSVQAEARASLIRLARENDLFAVAIVLDVPARLCHERNAERPDRSFGPHVVNQQRAQLRGSLKHLAKEGFKRVFVLDSQAEIDAAVIERQPLFTDRKSDRGPFDIIGDVHGCREELEALLGKLGYARTDGVYRHPNGRRAFFVGDLCDRGPDTPGVYRIAMSMVEAGTALAVTGNHDAKLHKWLSGKRVKLSHGLQASVDQLEREPEGFRAQVAGFIDGLVSHYVLDGGELVVAHAGLKEAYQGRSSSRVRAFCMYGETTGEMDEYGLPVRANWAADYRGKAAVVYGHTASSRAEWVNRTICIDTGCVFGGQLTALRWPERELVHVDAAKTYFESVRPLAPLAGTETREHGVLDIGDVSGKRSIETRFDHPVTIREENAAAALEIMSRFAIDPRWLVYLPPTMSPPETAPEGAWLERPEQCFDYFRSEGVRRLVCEEKHMGSRAIAIVCRTEKVGADRFGAEERLGVIYTRTGRPFFDDAALERAILERLREAARGLFEELSSDWIALDCELLPWSAKAQGLLREQYAPVGAVGSAALAEAAALFAKATERDPSLSPLAARFAERAGDLSRYVAAYRRYCWPVRSIDDLKVAPFHLLASEGAAHFDRDHLWHLARLARLSDADPALVRACAHVVVDLDDAESERAAIRFWEELTESGGEGMVVKPLEWILRGERTLVQPALKCRGREYLRIIYGPEYASADSLSRLRKRGLSGKRRLAIKEYALGLEALGRFVAKEPLYRVHECVFGVLALESEPVDPRL
jgi:protein phosphatase